MRSNLALSLSSERAWYDQGETVPLTVTLSDPAEVARLEAVHVDVYSPSRKRLAPLMRRLTHDPQTFVGRFVAEEAGYYAALGRGLGRRGDLRFERGEALILGVAGASARLSGSYSIEEHVAGLGGLGGGLHVVVGLDVREPKALLCSVTLADACGSTVATVAHLFQGSTDLQRVEVPIPAQALDRPHCDGPYTLSQVLLMDVSGASILLDEAESIAIPPALSAGYSTD